jgi:hypothetical protein
MDAPLLTTPPTVPTATPTPTPTPTAAPTIKKHSAGKADYPPGWCSDCELMCNCVDDTAVRSTPTVTRECRKNQNAGRHFHVCANGKQGDNDSGCGYFRWCRTDQWCCVTLCHCNLLASTSDDATPMHTCGNKRCDAKDRCKFRQACTVNCPQAPRQTPREPYTGAPSVMTIATAGPPYPSSSSSSAAQPPAAKRQKINDTMFVAGGGLLTPASMIFTIGFEKVEEIPGYVPPAAAAAASSSTTTTTTTTTAPAAAPAGWTKVVAYCDGNNWFAPTSPELKKKMSERLPPYPTAERWIKNSWVEKLDKQ